MIFREEVAVRGQGHREHSVVVPGVRSGGMVNLNKATRKTDLQSLTEIFGCGVGKYIRILDPR